MRNGQYFAYGQSVHVIHEKNLFYGEPAEIVGFIEKYKKYQIKIISTNQYLFVDPEEIGSWLGSEKLRQLHEAHLRVMQELAVEWNDREWFEELGVQLRTLQMQK